MLNAPSPALLQTFVAVVEFGSFTGAAKRVHRSQSAVSMQIQRLESGLGYRLFERGNHAVRLTPAGETFYDHAQRILRDYRAAMGALGHTEIEGDLSVGAPEDFVVTFLPRVLADFNRLYPRVRIHITSEPSRQLIHSLAAGSIDIALLTEGEGATGGTVIHHEPLVWVSSHERRCRLEDPVPLAIFHSGDIFRRCAVRELEDAGRQSVISLTCSGFSGLQAAVEAGTAVAVMFRASVLPSMRILTEREGFPPLPRIGVVLQQGDSASNELAEQFGAHIVRDIQRRSSERSGLLG